MAAVSAVRNLMVACDEAGTAIRTLPKPSDETLRRHRLAMPERFQKVELAVGPAPVSDAVGLAFEHHLKIHLESSLSSANVGIESVVEEGTVVRRALLPDVSRVGILLTLVGSRHSRRRAASLHAGAMRGGEKAVQIGRSLVGKPVTEIRHRCARA